MTEYELKAMSKTALIEEAMRLGRENEEMRDKLDRLQTQIKDMKARLEDRNIRLNDAGSIAQAAMSVNEVLERAQAAADQYLDSIRLMKQEQEETCARLIRETEEKCADMEAGTKRRCDEMYRAAEYEASVKWVGLAHQLETTVRDYIHGADEKPEA